MLIGTAAVSLISFMAGPLIHRPVNKQPWRWLAAAGGFYLCSLLVRLELVALPALQGTADLWSFAGYACTAAFLIGLLKRTRQSNGTSLWLDTAAITTGSALIGWVMSVAPQLAADQPRLGAMIVNAVYPVADTLLLTLTVQLAFRRGPEAPALQGAIAGMSGLLIGDRVLLAQLPQRLPGAHPQDRPRVHPQSGPGPAGP